MDMKKVIRIIDELIFEAQKEPKWKAENALRCLKKELLKEQETVCNTPKKNMPSRRLCGMNDDRIFFYIPRGLGKSLFRALVEIDFLYRTGQLSFEDYLNFMGEALIRLFGQSEEFVEDWKEKASQNQHT